MTDTQYYRGIRGLNTLDSCISYLGSKSRLTMYTLCDDLEIPISMARRLLHKMEKDLLIKEDYCSRGEYEVDLEIAAQFELERREVERLLTKLSSYDIDALCTIDRLWRDHLYSEEEEFDTDCWEEIQNLWSVGLLHNFNGKCLPSVGRSTIHLFTQLSVKDYAKETDKILIAEPILIECLRTDTLPRDVLDCPFLTSFCTEYISEKFAMYKFFGKMPMEKYASKNAIAKLDELFAVILGNIAVCRGIDTADELKKCVGTELKRVECIPQIANAKALFFGLTLKVPEIFGYIVNSLNNYNDEDLKKLKHRRTEG